MLQVKGLHTANTVPHPSKKSHYRERVRMNISGSLQCTEKVPQTMDRPWIIDGLHCVYKDVQGTLWS